MRPCRGIEPAILAVVALLWTAIPPTAARGDGGTLRVWKQEAGYDIAVFTEPSTLVVGPVDISVCLLDRTTGETIPGAQVVVEVRPPSRPAESIRHAVTQQAATNKLLRASTFTLPEAGQYRVKVEIDEATNHVELEFELFVLTPWLPETGMWPWILWPLPILMIYLVHRRLVQRKPRRQSH